MIVRKTPLKKSRTKTPPRDGHRVHSNRGSPKLSGTRPAKPPAHDAAIVKEKSPLTVLTIGHSTRPIGEFIKLLLAHEVTRVVDVRTVPRSRHNPQFNRDVLPASLKSAGIGYVHAPALGGLRRTTKESINTGWRNASFRGYADYMQTAEFTDAVETLIRWAKKDRLALMCAEAVPWRCHRSLIADALLARGIDVREIASTTDARAHALTPWARVEGMKVTYPGLPLTP